MSKGEFLKGMATGLVLGAATTMIVDPVSDRQRHRLIKKTQGVFRSIGGVMDTAMSFFS